MEETQSLKAEGINDAWFDIYKPKKLSELICHFEHVDVIAKWLENFNVVKKEAKNANNLKMIKNAKTIKSTKTLGLSQPSNADEIGVTLNDLGSKNKTSNDSANKNNNDNKSNILNKIILEKEQKRLSNSTVNSNISNSINNDNENFSDDFSEEYNEYEEETSVNTTKTKVGIDTCASKTSINKLKSSISANTDTQTNNTINTNSNLPNSSTKAKTNKTTKTNDIKSKTISTRTKKTKHYANMLIKGKHGIGKTVTITVILESLGYNIHKLSLLNILGKISKKDTSELDSATIHQKKLEKYLQKINGSNNIMKGMYDDPRRKNGNNLNDIKNQNFNVDIGSSSRQVTNSSIEMTTQLKQNKRNKRSKQTELHMEKKGNNKLITNELHNVDNAKLNYENSEAGETNTTSVSEIKKRPRVVILIDELEIITSTNEKKIILDLLKINNEKMHCPIILISNEKHNKLVHNVVNLSLQIKFSPPTSLQLEEILLKIGVINKMKITRDALNMIIEHAQGDIRRSILIIQGLYYSYGTEVISSKKMEKYQVVTSKKEVDPSLYEAADSLIYDYKNIFSSLKYYNAEKVMLPLMIHYNYIGYVIDKYPNKDDQYKIVLKVSDSLCQGDIIENYIYNDQQWDLQRIHGIYSCVEPSYILNVNNYYKSRYYPKNIYQSSFSTDLHKTSAKKQNIKKMIKLNKNLDNININDCIFINKLIDNGIKKNKVEEIVTCLKEDYDDIKYEHIDSIYKIDKLFVNKKGFDVKTQNKIKLVTHEGKINKTNPK